MIWYIKSLITNHEKIWLPLYIDIFLTKQKILTSYWNMISLIVKNVFVYIISSHQFIWKYFFAKCKAKLFIWPINCREKATVAEKKYVFLNFDFILLRSLKSCSVPLKNIQTDLQEAKNPKNFYAPAFARWLKFYEAVNTLFTKVVWLLKSDYLKLIFVKNDHYIPICRHPGRYLSVWQRFRFWL